MAENKVTKAEQGKREARTWKITAHHRSIDPSRLLFVYAACYPI